MSVDNPSDHYRDIIAPATFGQHVVLNVGDSLYSASRSIRLNMQLDGNLVLYVLTSGILPPPEGLGFLGNYGPITGSADDFLVQLSKQTNPNNPYTGALWSSKTNGVGQFAHADFQDDGNLVVYDQYGGARFATATDGNGYPLPQPEAFLRCQDDGNLVIYNRFGEPIWSSQTNVRTNL